MARFAKSVILLDRAFLPYDSANCEGLAHCLEKMKLGLSQRNKAVKLVELAYENNDI